MQRNTLLTLTLCGICLVLLPFITSAQGNFYITANAGFSLGFIYNHGVAISAKTHRSDPEIGKGFNSEFGIGRTFNNGRFSIESGLGTYEMSNPTDPYMLGLKLSNKAFTFKHTFYTGSLRIAYKIGQPMKKMSLELVGGSTFMFAYNNTYFDNTWVYPEDPAVWYGSDGLKMGRYKSQESHNTHTPVLFHAGLRLSYQVNSRLHIRSLLYYEQSFTTIRSVVYSSERDFATGDDLNYQMISVFSGDAIGLKIGVKYDLK